ncbi:hypothetical protein ACFLYJ_02250 [Candidatus Cloacimonadota bacterium]
MSKYLQEMLDNIPHWVAEKLRKLSQSEEQLTYLLESFIERAGIMEYDGELTREEAEKSALNIVINEHIKTHKDQ